MTDPFSVCELERELKVQVGEHVYVNRRDLDSVLKERARVQDQLAKLRKDTEEATRFGRDPEGGKLDEGRAYQAELVMAHLRIIMDRPGTT